MEFISQILSDHKLDGGALLFRYRAQFDNSDCVDVVCDKHPNYRMRVNVLNLSSSSEVLNAAYESLRKCPGCVEQSNWNCTKFPEGAEL